MSSVDAPPDRGGLLLTHVWFTPPKGVRPQEGWERRLEELADMAQPELWDDPAEPTGRLPILSNYLRYTYARLLEEEDGSKFVTGVDAHGNAIAAFNSGLFTVHFEPIICLLQAHRDGSGQWVFQDWVKSTDRRLRSLPHDRLRPAYFFDNPADLLLDPKLEIVPNIEHILDRMPDRAKEALPDDMVRQRIMLAGAAQEVVARVQMNWRLAVPQYYWPAGRHPGRIQLLLPLRLSSARPADLALVVERENHRYVGYTVLTVEMAYKNARLLSRPESDWLWVPALPVQSAEEMDDQSAPKWRRVSTADRCPVCGESTQCVIAADNRAAICTRIESGTAIETKQGKVWEHRLQVVA